MEDVAFEKRSFVIPASNQFIVQEKLNKFNNSADKLKLPKISWSFGKAFIKNTVLVIPIDIVGNFTIKYNHYIFVATIHQIDGANIIMSCSNIKVPEQYRSVSKKCDHCKTDRYRKDTYIIFDTVEKSFLQVGSSCIKDFLNNESPENIIAQFNLLSNLFYFVGSIDDFYESSNRADGFFHILEFLAQTSFSIRKNGWISKKDAEEKSLTSTAKSAIEYFYSKNIPSKEDYDIAELASTWAENLPEDVDSDYLHNIRTIARSGMVDIRTSGYAASIVSSYLKSIESKRQSNFISSPKKREVFRLNYNKKLVFRSSFGINYKYFFNDENGNIVIWSTANSIDFEKDILYSIKGTCKAHSEYNNIKQTEITRCEVLN